MYINSTFIPNRSTAFSPWRKTLFPPLVSMVTKCKVAAKIGNGQRKRQKEDPTRDNFVASRKKHQRIGITACRSRVQVSIQTEGELLTTVSDELSASGPFSAVAFASAPATRVNNVPKSKMREPLRKLRVSGIAQREVSPVDVHQSAIPRLTAIAN